MHVLAGHRLSQPLWWVGFSIWGVSFGVLDTTRTTLMSLRVSEKHQAKLQGVMQICYLVGQSLGLFVWGNYIFNPEAKGLAAGKGFLFSAGLLSLTLCVYALLLC